MENGDHGGSTPSELGRRGSAAQPQSSPSTSNGQSSSSEGQQPQFAMVASAASSVEASATSTGGEGGDDAEVHRRIAGATTSSCTRRLRSLPKHCIPKRSSSQVPTIAQKIGMSISSRTLASLPSLRWGHDHHHASHNSGSSSGHHHFHFNEARSVARLAADAHDQFSDGKKKKNKNSAKNKRRPAAVPRFNGVVSAFQRRTKSGSGGGGNELSDEHRRQRSRQIVRSSVEQLVSRNSNVNDARTVESEARSEEEEEERQGSDQQPGHRVAARSLLSNWLSLARSKIVKKENVKRQLQMSWCVFFLSFCLFLFTCMSAESGETTSCRNNVLSRLSVKLWSD